MLNIFVNINLILCYLYFIRIVNAISIVDFYGPKNFLENPGITMINTADIHQQMYSPELSKWKYYKPFYNLQYPQPFFSDENIELSTKEFVELNERSYLINGNSEILTSTSITFVNNGGYNNNNIMKVYSTTTSKENIKLNNDEEKKENKITLMQLEDESKESMLKQFKENQWKIKPYVIIYPNKMVLSNGKHIFDKKNSKSNSENIENIIQQYKKLFKSFNKPKLNNITYKETNRKRRNITLTNYNTKEEIKENLLKTNKVKSKTSSENNSNRRIQKINRKKKKNLESRKHRKMKKFKVIKTSMENNKPKNNYKLENLDKQQNIWTITEENQVKNLLKNKIKTTSEFPIKKILSFIKNKSIIQVNGLNNGNESDMLKITGELTPVYPTFTERICTNLCSTTDTCATTASHCSRETTSKQCSIITTINPDTSNSAATQLTKTNVKLFLIANDDKQFTTENNRKKITKENTGTQSVVEVLQTPAEFKDDRFQTTENIVCK